MEMTFTNVFYEESYQSAQKRLNDLREKDKYPEIKAYIIQIEDGSWRVLRRIKITTSPQPHSQPVSTPKVVRTKRLRAKKAGR